MDGDGERPRAAGFGATVAAVLWSFFGVRRQSDHDAERLNPIAVIVAGVLAAALLVAGLLAIVHAVVK